MEVASSVYARSDRAPDGRAGARIWGMATGARVRTLRIEQNLTQQAMADLADLSISAVSRIERGERPPSIRILRKLAAVLEADINGLLGVDEC